MDTHTHTCSGWHGPRAAVLQWGGTWLCQECAYAEYENLKLSDRGGEAYWLRNRLMGMT